MDPTFLQEPAEAAPGRLRTLAGRLRGLGRGMWSGLGAILLWEPLRRDKTLRIEDATPATRAIRGVLYRLAFVPVLLAIAASLLVWIATHPPVIASDRDPAGEGLYYDAVALPGPDGSRLDAWLIPVVDADAILREGEAALRTRHPAVILVHDHGHGRHQMLPLIRPLHDAGFVVLVLGTRGSVTNNVGRTFGLREAEDVRAAADLLRRRPYVDPRRVAVVGIGSGATAAALASRSDPLLKTLVLDGLPTGTDRIVRDYLGPRFEWLHWIDPICKWTFETAYRVDLDEATTHRILPALRGRDVMLLHAETRPQASQYAGEIRDFLVRHLISRPATLSNGD
jgi:hypothetical protein